VRSTGFDPLLSFAIDGRIADRIVLTCALQAAAGHARVVSKVV
jgi:hypothetical protein